MNWKKNTIASSESKNPLLALTGPIEPVAVQSAKNNLGSEDSSDLSTPSLMDDVRGTATDSSFEMPESNPGYNPEGFSVPNSESNLAAILKLQRTMDEFKFQVEEAQTASQNTFDELSYVKSRLVAVEGANPELYADLTKKVEQLQKKQKSLVRKLTRVKQKKRAAIKKKVSHKAPPFKLEYIGLWNGRDNLIVTYNGKLTTLYKGSQLEGWMVEDFNDFNQEVRLRYKINKPITVKVGK